MQRREPEGIVISCDFCGTDWDQVKPMIEGHRGSVICLACLTQAMQQMRVGDGEYECRLCLRSKLPASLPRWSNPAHPPAAICRDCVRQAAGAFDKDPDVDWKWNRSA